MAQTVQTSSSDVLPCHQAAPRRPAHSGWRGSADARRISEPPQRRGHPGTAADAERTLSELFAVSLVQVADGALILRGYEKDEARGVLQAWRCEPLDTRHGFDRMGRRLDGDHT